jgi:hypothetical protein
VLMRNLILDKIANRKITTSTKLRERRSKMFSNLCR